jgi:hypothetical protein
VPVTGQAGEYSAVGVKDKELDVVRACAISRIYGIFIGQVPAGGSGVFHVLNVAVTANKIVFEKREDWFG